MILKMVKWYTAIIEIKDSGTIISMGYNISTIRKSNNRYSLINMDLWVSIIAAIVNFVNTHIHCGISYHTCMLKTLCM